MVLFLANVSLVEALKPRVFPCCFGHLISLLLQSLYHQRILFLFLRCLFLFIFEGLLQEVYLLKEHGLLDFLLIPTDVGLDLLVTFLERYPLEHGK